MGASTFSNFLPTPHHQRNRSAGGERGTHQQQASLELSGRGAYYPNHIRANKSSEISDRINECNPGRGRRADEDAGADNRADTQRDQTRPF